MTKPGEKDALTYALGRVIATRRRTAGLSQEQLAFRCKMHPTSISHIERGVNSPTVRVLGVIASALAARVSALLADAETTIP